MDTAVKKPRFATGAKTKLGNRRTPGCGDKLGRQLLGCVTIADMVAFARRIGLPAQDVNPYLKSRLHLGVVRMAIGNRIRAFLRRKEAESFRKDVVGKTEYQVES